MRNWKVLEWPDRPQLTKKIEFHCVNCGIGSNLEVGSYNAILAQVGMGVIYDESPSGGEIPNIIRCPHCRHSFERGGKEEAGDVR